MIANDDFIGIQNYTRELVGPNGALPVPDGAEKTQMGYEYYPGSLEPVIRKVAAAFPGELFVTENGVSTDDDNRRVAYIAEAMAGLSRCLDDGLPLVGYTHWSLLDNFEWQAGYSKTFGLIAVDRKTQKRKAKPSLVFFGSFAPKEETK